MFRRAGKIWVGTRGEEPRELSQFSEIPLSATLMGFSPDGSRLAALAGDEVWIVPYSGGGPPKRHAVEFVEAASWMPDSRRLVLTRILGPEAHTLSMLDTVSGDHRVFYASSQAITSGAVSGDGKRLAYVAGRIEWNVLEVSTEDARARTLTAAGDISHYPAWAPGGTRYVFARYRGGRWSIEEASVADGFSRRLLELAQSSAWFVEMAPDGRQLTFMVSESDGPRLMLGNMSGQMSPLDPGAPGPTSDAIWSPDGKYVIYLRTIPGERFELARLRPGSTSPAEVLATVPITDIARLRVPMAWSPDGTLILTRSEGSPRQFYLSSADFTGERPVRSERLCAQSTGFSKDGRALLGVCQNTSIAGAPWQLWSVDVGTGRERLVGNVDLPGAVAGVAGFSLHPDGTRIITSVGILPFDIWMIEGFEPQSGQFPHALRAED